jgi:hypothetical protein
MQSILQYRRLRREVQEDLARARQAKRPAGSPTGTSTGTFTLDPEAENEPGTGAAEEKPAPSVDTPLVPGVIVSRPDEADGSVVFMVGWKENDPNNPQDWTLTKKWMAMLTCCVLAIALTLPTSVEGPAQEAFNEYFGVEPMAGSMTTGKTSPAQLAITSAN